MNVVLCVIFNHPYPRNIPLIKKMYSNKFRQIIFIQPIESSDRDDVVVSYRGSYNFQGMMVDVLPRLEEMSAEYVVFMQDDCLLNPFFDERNILKELKVEEDVPFHPYFAPLTGSIETWAWTLTTVWKVVYSGNALTGTGVENYRRYLPDAVTAREHLSSRYGMKFSPISNVELVTRRFGALADPESDQRLTSTLIEGLFKTAPGGEIALEFPWLYGVSDFTVMSMPSLRKISLFLGVTAATNIFVEVAIPTALAVLHEKVSTTAMTGWHMNYVWDTAREAVSVEGALSSFANRCAMLHPVKLSSQFAMAEEIFRRSSATKNI